MIKNSSFNDLAYSTKKRQNVNKVGSLTYEFLKPFVKVYGEAFVKIAIEWPDIVGAKFSTLTQVKSLHFPKKDRHTEGVLYLRAVSSSIPLLQMQIPILIEKINRYFGYKAIASIRFQAGLAAPSSRVKSKEVVELSAEQKDHILKTVTHIDNHDLKEALRQLGEGIFLKKSKSTMSSSTINKNNFIDYFKKGEKNKQNLLIGVEVEQFIINKHHQRLPYKADSLGPGVYDILKFFENFHYEGVFEDQTLIGLQHQKNQQAISIEPGGQFEFASSPLLTLHDIYQELQTHHQHIKQAEKELGVRFIAQGFDQLHSLEDIPWMPKKRYEIMKAYMPKVGRLGLEMMKRTCTVQLNLDYTSEEDMVYKMRVSMALQPFITGYFANSFNQEEGKNYKAYRTYIWQNTDKARSGLLSFVFNKDFGYSTYADYILSLPMYFIKRDGTYYNVSGASFIDFMEGKLKGYENLSPTENDIKDQLSIAFPEVRLKSYLELRGADSQDLPQQMRLAAFWVGLLYDEENLKMLHQWVMQQPYKELEKLYDDIPIYGKDAIYQGRPITHWIDQWSKLSHEGLKKRKLNEEIYLSV